MTLDRGLPPVLVYPSTCRYVGVVIHLSWFSRFQCVCQRSGRRRRGRVTETNGYPCGSRFILIRTVDELCHRPSLGSLCYHNNCYNNDWDSWTPTYIESREKEDPLKVKDLAPGRKSRSFDTIYEGVVAHTHTERDPRPPSSQLQPSRTHTQTRAHTHTHSRPPSS